MVSGSLMSVNSQSWILSSDIWEWVKARGGSITQTQEGRLAGQQYQQLAYGVPDAILTLQSGLLVVLTPFYR